MPLSWRQKGCVIINFNPVYSNRERNHLDTLFKIAKLTLESVHAQMSCNQYARTTLK